jgi:large subunit ribosomal protein L3
MKKFLFQEDLPKKEMQSVRALKAAVSKTGLSPCGIQRTLRAGLIAMKQGMTATWDQHGKRHPLTILQVGVNHVVQEEETLFSFLHSPFNTLFFSQIKRPEVDGYSALQIGAFDCPPKNVTKPLLFHFQAAGVAPKRVLKEFPVTHDAVVPVGRCYSQVFTAGPSC